MKRRECKKCIGRGYTGTVVAMKGQTKGNKLQCTSCGGIGFKMIKTEEEQKAEAIKAEVDKQVEKVKEALEVK